MPYHLWEGSVINAVIYMMLCCDWVAAWGVRWNKKALKSDSNDANAGDVLRIIHVAMVGVNCQPLQKPFCDNEVVRMWCDEGH